jgi:hypothetical protein
MTQPSPSLPPLPAVIQFLRDVARAPATQWEAAARAADTLKPVPIGEAGAAAALLALQVKPLVKQLTQVVPLAEAPLRMVLANLADALQMEFNERGYQPFHADRD